MARRKHHEEHANHEAWAIPYADLMTLLLAFFVVMYAISSVNEGKYRIMADALTDAFGGAPRTINPVQVGNKQVQGGGWDSPSVIKSGTKVGPSAPAPSHDPTLLPSMASQMRMPVSVHNQEQIARAERQLNSIADRLTAALAPLIDRGMISVRRTELWIEVEINSDILFPTGSAALDVHARQTLASLAEVLRDVPNSVRVEGHTDNVPIATATFPSNWELSAGRAASVVHLFADQGVQPSRLAMVGYGQFRPREENDSAQGRNRNRRVMVIILADTSHSVDPLGQRLNAATATPESTATEQAAATPATVTTSPIAPVKLPPVPAGSRVGAAVPPAMKE
ncbi:TPA: flagellar motor protein MotD [Stenotrophomonas maltophilia]|nr:flagellar motor protein MotD [Stenotrophomonas maltophilia]